jgi:hypothetical protein
VADVSGDIDATGGGAIHQALVGRSGAWFPLTWTLRLRPAKLFAWDAKVRVFAIRTVRSAEEYVSSRGRLVAGRRVFDGEQIDRAEYALLWAWTLALAPHAVARRPDVMWEREEPAAARIIFPFEQEMLEARLGFDEHTGLLRRYEARRFEPRAGYPRQWALELDDYRELGGRFLPTELAWAWDGEPTMQLQLHTT